MTGRFRDYVWTPDGAAETNAVKLTGHDINGQVGVARAHGEATPFAA